MSIHNIARAVVSNRQEAAIIAAACGFVLYLERMDNRLERVETKVGGIEVAMLDAVKALQDQAWTKRDMRYWARILDLSNPPELEVPPVEDN